MYPFIHITKKKLLSILKPFSGKKICIIHGKNSYESSGAKVLFDFCLQKLGILFLEHCNFTANPKWEEIEPILVTVKKFKPELFIAIGGGSVIDTAKLLRFFYLNDGTPLEYDQEPKNSKCKLYALPTTSGSGSEATQFAVCYVKGKKYSVSGPNLLPDKIFVDYRFALNNPPYLTACSGLDALCQGIESLWSVNGTTVSRIYAKKAIRLLYPNLYVCVHNPNPKVRKKVSKGSYWAGKAINISTTTAPHAYSYKITSLLGIPHGHAVAISMPYFFKVNSRISKENCSSEEKYSILTKNIRQLNKMLKMDYKGLEKYINEITMGLYKPIFPNTYEWEKIVSEVNIQRLLNNPTLITQKPKIEDFCW